MSLRDIGCSFERVRVDPAKGKAAFWVDLSFPDGRRERFGWKGSMNPDREELFNDLAVRAIEGRDMSAQEYAARHGLSPYMGKEEHGYCRILLGRVRKIFGSEDDFAGMVANDFRPDAPGM